jgi:hypothetical protein
MPFLKEGKFKTKEQLNQDFVILKKKFQEKEKEYRKIRNKFEESDLLSKSDDDDLRQKLLCRIPHVVFATSQ